MEAERKFHSCIQVWEFWRFFGVFFQKNSKSRIGCIIIIIINDNWASGTWDVSRLLTIFGVCGLAGRGSGGGAGSWGGSPALQLILSSWGG